MTAALAFQQNVATAAEIADHLRQCDDAFVPRLSARVDIPRYAGKLAQHAKTFEAWAEGHLVGLVAIYINDKPQPNAFVTNVSVLRDYRTLGVASQLLDECVAFVRTGGSERLALDVDRANQAAIDLYTKTGFQIVEVDGSRLRMERKLRGDQSMGGEQ
jgi:ribosomal protein S18 acetylase RimI-like enzyme